MKTLSIHVTQLEENDKELCYFDELSLFVGKLAKHFKLFDSKLINISDYYAESLDKTKEVISNIIELLKTDNSFDNNIITISVDINPLEFPPEIVCTEEIAEQIQKSLMDKIELMKEIGFIKIDYEIFQSVNAFYFIYNNEMGGKLMDRLAGVDMYRFYNEELLDDVERIS